MQEENKIIDALKEHFGAEEISRAVDSDCWGLQAFNVDGDVYLVGDYDECYAAAKEEAKDCFNDAYRDEDKIDWLQKWNWPGVDEESLCEDLGDDPSDYEEGETIYKPSSISEYLDNMGFSQASNAFSWDFLRAYVDLDELGEFVVDTDGIANGLARYDGIEVELPNDLYAYRVD